MDFFNLSSQLKHDANFTVTDLSGTIFPYEYGSVMLKWCSYNWVTPLNLLLSLFVVSQNIVIVRFYFLHGTGITQRIYFWIGIADIFSAIGMIVFSISSILFYNDMIDRLPFQRGILVFVLLFPAASACSRSLNVFVAMIKTMNIASIARRGIPVQINNIAVFIVSFATFLLWLTLSTCDQILYWNNSAIDGPRVEGTVDYLIYALLQISSVVGTKTLSEFIPMAMISSPSYVYDVMITIHFVLPSIIMFICMIIQAHSIKSSIQQDSNSNQPSSSYINMTIFMVTALFCVCHTVYSIAYIVILHSKIFNSSIELEEILIVSLTEFMLPLLNSALFPVIIILRKQSLRERYRDLFLRVFSVVRSGVSVVGGWCGGVVTWVGGVVTWVAGRRADYEEVSSSETP